MTQQRSLIYRAVALLLDILGSDGGGGGGVAPGATKYDGGVGSDSADGPAPGRF